MLDRLKVSDARCLLCGRVIGQVRAAKFVHDPGCALPLRISGGHLRCCSCGGSLFLEPAGFMEPDHAGPRPTPQKRVKRG